MTDTTDTGTGNWPEKSYKNLAFLNSDDARTIRVMCEFEEPESRLRRFGVEDTIVFFGSARAEPLESARQRLKAAQAAVKGLDDPPEEARQNLVQAEQRVRLAKYYEDATTLAERLTRWSMSLPQPGRRFILCSGGGPGMMEAANRGASQAGGISTGFNISLPFEQTPNQYQTRELSFEFHYFFIRKFWFLYLAKALVVFPGGFGTMDELFETLTLIQTKKMSRPRIIVVYGTEFWRNLINFDLLVEWGVISPNDLELFHFFDDVDSAFCFLRDELTRLYL
jgi:uncharacterized protein (TIGR00730 family)